MGDPVTCETFPGLTFKDKAQRTRFLLLQAATLIQAGKTLPSEVARAASDALQAVLAAKPSDKLGSVVHAGKPYKKSKDHVRVAEFSRHYRELRQDPSLKHADITNKIMQDMGIFERRTAERYWNKGPSVDVWLEDNCPEAVAAWKEKHYGE